MTASVELLCCAVSDVESVLLSRYENLLSEEELARLRAFRSPASAKEFVVGRALLRTALAEKLNCRPYELQFARNDDGKPALAQPVSAWQFNLSHSHDWVVLALCEGGSIGIDVESHHRRNNLSAIAQRFFSEQENAQLTNCDPSTWLDVFFAVWTLKEAHAKALGCGLAKILSCSSIAVDLSAGTIAMALNDVADTAANVSSWLYRLDSHSSLATVAHGNEFSAPKLFRGVPTVQKQSIALPLLAQGFKAS